MTQTKQIQVLFHTRSQNLPASATFHLKFSDYMQPDNKLTTHKIVKTCLFGMLQDMEM